MYVRKGDIDSEKKNPATDSSSERLVSLVNYIAVIDLFVMTVHMSQLFPHTLLYVIKPVDILVFRVAVSYSIIHRLYTVCI